MNKYLLLRNNKQSGPFTVEELAAIGIKPYDLVWLEGKSAAWRYPSEMDDLKAFAPAVEEQPYDRFYKKPAQENSIIEEKENLTPGLVFKKPDQKLQTVGGSKLKSIYVTLPATQQAKQSANTIQEKPKATNGSETNNKNGVKKPVQLVNESEPIAAKTNIDLPKQESIKPIESFSRLIEDSQKNYQAKSLPIQNSRESGSGKKSIRLLFGICAFLCIVVVIQAILYSRNMSATRELDALVKQIQAAENKKNNTAAAEEQKQNTAKNTEDINSNTADLSLQPPVTIVDKEEKKEFAAKHNTRDVPAKKQNETVVISDQTENETASTPTSTNSNEEDVQKNEASVELARKNLSQLVSVEKNKYKTGVFGGISNLQLTLSNKSLYYIDRVEVEINYLNAEKKLVRTQTVYFDKIGAGEQLTLDVPKSKRGVFIDYSVKKISSKEVDLAGR